MNPKGNEPASTLDRLAPWLILALPILIGLLFWADSCGHPDSVDYRRMISGTWENGRLPAGRMEWLHPGQYLIAAPIYGLGKTIGIWTDPLRVSSLLNFIALGWAGLTVFFLIRRVLPERSASLAMLMGISVVSLPGSLWMSQMALTDVLGHSLVLIWACRLLIHEAEAAIPSGDPESASRRILRQASWSFTGFLATYAILIRMSSGLFVFLFLFLAARAVLATRGKGPRLQRCIALVLGGALPVVAVFGHYVYNFGWTEFWNSYFKMTNDNIGMRTSLDVLTKTWSTHTLYGSGPVLAWVGGTGAALVLLQLLMRPKLKWLGDRRILLWIAFLLCMPYLVAVARNRAWYEFRYLLPVMTFVSLGVLGWGWLVDRFLGARVTALLTVSLLVANLIHAQPWLSTFGSRTHFSEATARLLNEKVESGSFVIAHLAGAHIEYQAKKRFAVIGVRHTEASGGPDFWNRSWQESRNEMQNAIANDRRVYGTDEESLGPFLEDLRKRGWKIETAHRVPFDGLRNAYDANLATMRLDLALQARPLRILRFTPPAEAAEPLVRLVLDKEASSEGRAAFVVSTRPGKGLAYRLLFYKEDSDDWLYLEGRTMLPASKSDPILIHSSRIDPVAQSELAFVGGMLDPQGQARFEIPARFLEILKGSTMVALIHDSKVLWTEARIRSRGTIIP